VFWRELKFAITECGYLPIFWFCDNIEEMLRRPAKCGTMKHCALFINYKSLERVIVSLPVRKKIVFGVLFLLLLFTFSVKILACQYDNSCDPSIYDCNHHIGSFEDTTGVGDAGCAIYSECQGSGNCCGEEVGNGFVVCYQEDGQPTPPPCTAGTDGCQCRPAPNFCDSGLNPIPVGSSCICSTLPAMPSAQPDSPNIIEPEKCFEIIDNPYTPGGTLQYVGIKTALGCFPTEPEWVIKWIIQYAIMFAGGVGFLLMVYASVQIMTSSGDPEKLQAGKQMLTSAIMGILLIVFSLFIIRLIGYDILRIPGFE